MGSFLRREKLKILMLAVLVLSSCSIHQNGTRNVSEARSVVDGTRGVASSQSEIVCSEITVNKQYRADRNGLSLLQDHMNSFCDQSFKFSTSVIKEKGEVTGYLACCTPR